MPRGPLLVFWLILYAATMAAIAWGLLYARRGVLEQLANPEAIDQWRDWTAEAQRPNGAVERRTVRIDEPPSLVLMRDHFAAVMGVSLLIGSFLFAFMAFVATGVARGQTRPYEDGDQ